MTITPRQASYVAVTSILIAVLLTSLGLGFPLSPFGRATLADHSVHISLWMAFFLALVSLIYQIIQLRSKSRDTPSGWTVSQVLLWILAGFLLISEWQGWRFTQANWHSSFKVLAVAGPLVFLVFVLFLPFLKHLPTEIPTASEVRKWGRLVAVLVMLLAMFAFGIEIKEETSEDGRSVRSPSVKWTELPAILIVFVLADFGLELVVLSMESDEKIRSAADDAKAAATGAERAVSKLGDAEEAINKAKEAALQSVQKLSTWVGATHQIQQELNDGAIGIPHRLGIHPDDYFKKLFCFSRSWVPGDELRKETGVSLDTETGRLLGDLFTEFVGAKEENGTVRRFSDRVCCITADAVFAEVSKRWLGNITREGEQNGLVVYALTTLLPSEFAFPSAYRGRGDLDAARISSLYQFTSAVMSSCAGASVSEYRRITVFEQDKAETFRRLAEGHGTTPCSLDTWFILDPRVGSRGKTAGDVRRTLAEFLVVAEDQMGITVRDALTKHNLKAVFGTGGHPAQPTDYQDTRPDIFPYHTSAADASVFIVHLPEGGKMAVFGPVGPTLRPPMNHYPDCASWLRQEGWLSLRDWYCQCLHKCSKDQEGAWWAQLNDKSASVIKNFCIEWDATPVTTLDLLLIGSKRSDGEKWYGAAISNLSFNRTECTVQLVTDEAKLQSIAEKVKQLCNDFRRPADGEQFPLQSFGTWRNWPLPEWTASQVGVLQAAAGDATSATVDGKAGGEPPISQPSRDA